MQDDLPNFMVLSVILMKRDMGLPAGCQVNVM